MVKPITQEYYRGIFYKVLNTPRGYVFAVNGVPSDDEYKDSRSAESAARATIERLVPDDPQDTTPSTT